MVAQEVEAPQCAWPALLVLDSVWFASFCNNRSEQGLFPPISDRWKRRLLFHRIEVGFEPRSLVLWAQGLTLEFFSHLGSVVWHTGSTIESQPETIGFGALSNPISGKSFLCPPHRVVIIFLNQSGSRVPGRHPFQECREDHGKILKCSVNTGKEYHS